MWFAMLCSAGVLAYQNLRQARGRNCSIIYPCPAQDKWRTALYNARDLNGDLLACWKRSGVLRDCGRGSTSFCSFSMKMNINTVFGLTKLLVKATLKSLKSPTSVSAMLASILASRRTGLPPAKTHAGLSRPPGTSSAGIFWPPFSLFQNLLISFR
jgi:hypothetical protein